MTKKEALSMLLTLSIKNFILIESLHLELGPGFYVITGETGSGKSILLHSILFVLGEKFDTQVVKSGAEVASITAEFSMSPSLSAILKDHAIDPSDTLLIKRQQSQDGKKKFFINDEPVTQKLVAIIAEELLEMHGQHSYSELLDSSKHLKILDKFASLEEDRLALSTKYNEWLKLEQNLEMISKNRDQINREIDYLEFVTSELQTKAPQIGEEAELANTRIQLQQYSKNQALIKDLTEFLGRANLPSSISNMQRMIDRQIKDDSFAEVQHNLEQVQIYLNEIEESIAKLSIEKDENDLEKVELRLFEIRDLARKYKIDPDSLMDYLKTSEEKLNVLKSQVEDDKNAAANLEKLQSEYLAAARTLSSKRKDAAKILEQKIHKELEPLRMKNCIWNIEITEKSGSSTGIDEVRFIASTNPGMPPAPIDKIASGGELARLMLAVKVALFDKFSKPTIIFDEIDTGIGGSVADAIGERLLHLSKAAQTIVITHQPQVAAKANYNILVTKTTNGTSTYSSAKILSDHEKKEEIARMLSGHKITDSAMAAAADLISS